MLAICTTHLILLDLITAIISGDEGRHKQRFTKEQYRESQT
jgi:hypothetical protein